MTRASSASLKSSCMAVVRSAAGPPSKSTMPCSPPSTSPTAPNGLNQLPHDLRKLKRHGLLQRDGPPLRLPSLPQRGSGCPVLSVLPQTALRPTGQQPLPPPPRPPAPDG